MAHLSVFGGELSTKSSGGVLLGRIQHWIELFEEDVLLHAGS
jgi:hypothetical protein